MRRKLTIAMLLSLSASSLQALALGVGEASVNSPLNAPLRATIPLTDTGGLEPELLKVSVAESREFESAGLTRSPLAASVSTAVQMRDGQLVVNLITERAVREPWLDLMLSFEWPGGRQLREVTLLLDPPDYDQLPVLVGLSPTPAPDMAERSAAESEREAPSRPAVTQPRDAQSGDPAWVSSGDTLWAVAGRLRPDSSISMDQMMVALVEANPDVFPSGNINAMRAEHALVVPARDAIAARSSQQAGEVVQAMNQAWASRGSGAPARVSFGTSEVAIAEATAADSSELADPLTESEPERQASSVDDGTAAIDMPTAVEEASEPRLTLLTDAELAAEAAFAEQSAEGGAGGAETEASTFSEAEQASPGSQLDPEVLVMLDGEALVPQSETQRLESLERRWLESRGELEAVQAERDALQQELGGLRSEVDAMRDQLAALVAGGQGVDGPGGGGMVPPGGGVIESEVPWWGAVYQDGLDRQLMLGGAGLAALLGLWLLIRRRRSRETASTKSFATMPSVTYGAPVGSASVPPVSSTTAPSVAGMSVASAESVVERPAPMPQAEAISEADIFMAYGRYDQARESLLAGLAREPERDDLRLKLLTVHVEQGDWPSAEGEAARIAEGGDPALVAEVSRLMAAHRAAVSDVDGGRETAPAEFTSARELPPQAFDSLLDSQGGGTEEGGEVAHKAPFFKTPTSSNAESDEGDEGDEGYDATGPGSEVEPAPLLGRVDGMSAARPAADPGHAGEDSTVKWDMIDYQPPTLDPEPGRREETPMQPSIDFPTTGSGVVEEGEVAADSDRELAPENAAFLSDLSLGQTPQAEEDEWEVEEVAFPPLDRDNEGASDTLAGFEELKEARRLLDVGETDRGHALLLRLRDSAADPRLQAQAKELITHYRL